MVWSETALLQSGLGAGARPSGAVQDVLICGWGDSTFMVALLHSMDEELPKGSQVTVLNLRPKEEVLGERPQIIYSPLNILPKSLHTISGSERCPGTPCAVDTLISPAMWCCG